MSSEHLAKELKPVAEEAKEHLATVESFKIQTQEDLDIAQEVVQDIKAKWLRLEEKRTAITKPQNEALRATNALFKPAQDYYKRCEGILKKKIAKGIVFLRQEQTRRLQQAAELSSRGDLVGARAAMMKAPEARLPDSVSIRDILDFAVLDADKVPREYLSIDIDKVNKALQGGVKSIPGLRIFYRPSVTVRK